MGGLIEGRALVAGDVEGELLVSTEPLSLWGGYDQTSGEIIDRRHPLSGQMAGGKILALPSSRGSSTTAAVLLEAVRRETAPAAILTEGTDRFLTLAAIVAGEMYGVVLPVVALTREQMAGLVPGSRLRIDRGGGVACADDAEGSRRAEEPERG